MSDYKYTKQGEKILIIQELENGFIGKKMMCEQAAFEDESYEYESDESYFFENLLSHPPLQVIEDEYKKTKTELKSLKQQVKDIKVDISKKQFTLKDLNRFPIVEALYKYLRGQFGFVVYIKDLRIYDKTKVYQTPHVRTANIKVHGWVLYKMSNDNYMSSDDRAFLIFDIKSDAIDFCKDQILRRINEFKTSYHPVTRFKEMMRNNSNVDELYSDKDIIKARDKKLQELINQADKEKKEKIEAKQKELENLKKSLS